MLKEHEIATLIEQDMTSERKQGVKTGERYYEGKHDILNYRLYYYNADGQLIEDKTRSNVKISHPFFTEIVDQCVQYVLSGSDSIVKSDIPELQQELNLYFDDNFKSELGETLTDVCTGGFGYMYSYKNADDRTQFIYADSYGVVEVRAKDTDDQTEYVIYWYIDRIDKGQKKIKRIQVWDAEQVTYYVQVDYGKIELDESEPMNPRPHIIYRTTTDEGTYGDSLGYIPFFRIDNDRLQTSHLKTIKPIIDDYDLMSCGLSNNLQDMNEALYVVKGFQGHDMEELIQNVKTKKHIGVEPDGDVDIKTIDIPYEARKTKLEIDEKNIYRFGMGFNSSSFEGGSNITNVLIKSRYSLLDMKANKLCVQLRAFLRKLVHIALSEINEINQTAYETRDIYFNLEREMLMNELDNAQIELVQAQKEQVKITTLLNVASLIDSETVLQEICAALDLDYERATINDFDLNAASELLLDE